MGAVCVVGRFKVLCLDVTGKTQHFVPKQRVYSRYTDFCDNEGLSSESQQELTTMLKKDPGISDGQRTPAGESSQVRCYEGVLLDEGRRKCSPTTKYRFKV